VLALEEVISSAPLAPRVDGGISAIGRRFPDGRDVAPVDAAFLASADRCSDGWRLGDEEATCHLQAVAAFESPTRAETMWRPLVGLQLVGYVVSGLTLVAIAFYRLVWFRIAGRGRE
jgi:hypothetical protein